MPPRFQHGYQYDVFLSYAWSDDNEDAAGWKWISRFETDLRSQLEAVSGKTAEIFRDQKHLSSYDRVDASITEALNNTAVLLVVLSPNYLTSGYCELERGIFRAVAPDIGNRARIVKVAKTGVDRARYPDDLKTLNENKFYVEIANGFRDLHLHEDPTFRSLYAPRVDDVAQELNRLLTLLEPQAKQASSKGTVFLAETSSDLENQRLQIRRSLIQLGYEVLPQSPLRLLSAPDLVRALDENLSRATLTIHPVGERYGLIPELAVDKSVVRLQLESAALDQRNGSLPRLVWLPSGLEPTEPQQRKLIDEIQNRWAGKPFQIIEGSLEKFQTELPTWLQRTDPARKTAKRRPSIYVLCADDADRKAARPLRVFLNSRNIDVGPTSPSAEGHAKRLANDDGFLIFYGTCLDEWVYQKVNEVAAAQPGQSSERRVVYLADPKTEDKEDFLTNDAQVVHAYGAPPESMLMALVGGGPPDSQRAAAQTGGQ